MLKKQHVDRRIKNDHTTARIAVVVSRYNSEFTQVLEKKCLETLNKGGIVPRHVGVFHVPGAFEIPILCQRLAMQKRFSVIIALGCIIKGETYHFNLVANECARGVMQVSLDNNIPIIFEVLACYSRADALRRAQNDRYNKGIEAANGALAFLAELSKIRQKV